MSGFSHSDGAERHKIL